MKKIVFFLFFGTLFMACTKDAYKGEKPNSEFSVPADFEWKTLDRKTVTLTETSSVYLERENQTGKTERLLLGEELEPGDYSFVVSSFGGQLVTEPIGGLGRSVSRADEGNQNHIYFPAGGGRATMVFEDLFPSTGDLDMNDVVFDFRIMYKLDQKGGGEESRVHYIEIEVWPRAMGGSVYSTIGLAANLLADDFVIKDVKYTNVNVEGELFNVDENGIEIGSSSVVPLCANLYDHFGGQKGIINTYEDREKIKATSFSVRINFDNGKDKEFPLYSQLSLLAENGKLLDLFAVMGERGREVHRKGCVPTKLFNPEYLSEDSNNLNFCSKSNNYVWALIIDNSFKYPIEKKAVYEVYPDFLNWVKGEYDGDWTFDAVSNFQYNK